MQPEMMRKNIPSEDQPHSFGIHTYEFRSCVVSKRTPVDREDAIDSLSQMMATKGSVYVVLGGKNLGKTLLTSEGNRD